MNQDDLSSQEGLDPSWWEHFGDHLDLGMFYISEQDNLVYLNPILKDWLELPSVSAADEESFWEALSSLAADPAQAISQFRRIKENYPAQRVLHFPLETGQKSLFILLYASSNLRNEEGGIGGFVSKGAESARRIIDLVKVFDNLFVPARQLTAAVQGNLQALSGNLQIWSPEVLDQFLDLAREDINRLRLFLDLGLSYLFVLDQTSLFNQPVSLVDLIASIIHEQGSDTVRLRQVTAEQENRLLVDVDQAMVKVTLETLLREVADQTPPGQQSEILLSKRGGFVILSIDSPRMLPLPGLVSDTLEKQPAEMGLELYLANEILSALGGNLIYEPRLAEEGGGLDIEVALPALDQSQSQPRRQAWRELFGSGTGRILVAEAQPEYQLQIQDAFTDVGYRVDLAADGNIVLDMIQTRQPDLIILARDLPGMDGLLITQGVRRWSAVPIIMISMRDSVDDRLYAYRLGVDDYLQKPFLMEELLAKVRIFRSRQEVARGSIAPEIFHEGSIRIDYATRQVWVRGNLVQLTPIEYNLMVYLTRQGRQIIPYEQLLENVWEGPEKGTRQGLFVHVRRLREKIERDPRNPLIIINKWGIGYEFNP